MKKFSSLLLILFVFSPFTTFVNQVVAQPISIADPIIRTSANTAIKIIAGVVGVELLNSSGANLEDLKLPELDKFGDKYLMLVLELKKLDNQLMVVNILKTG